MKVNSFKAWVLASRPKTLSGAAVPVMIGTAMAIHDTLYDIRIVPAILCFLFAFLMQIDANFINDYFDFVKGTDDETRLGPKRACAQGWITKPAMRRGIALTTILSCIVGLPLIFYGGMADDCGRSGMRAFLLPIHNMYVVYGTGRCVGDCVLRFRTCVSYLLS